MAWTLDRASIGTVGVSNGYGGGSVAITTNVVVASAAWIILCVRWRFTDPISVAGGGLSWTPSTANNFAGDERVSAVRAYAAAGLASGTTITVTFTGGDNDARMVGGSSFLGGNSGSFDKEATNLGGAVTPWSSGNVVTAVANELLVACHSNANPNVTNTATAPSVEDVDSGDATAVSQLIIQHRIISGAAGTYTSDGTLLSAPEGWGVVTLAMEPTVVASGAPGDDPPIGISGRGAGW